MAGTARNLNSTSTRRRRARSTEDEQALALPEAVPEPSAERAAPRRATADSGLIDRWRTLPPHVRQGSTGALTAVVGMAGYAALIARGDAHSPLSLFGHLWYVFAGEGGYALAVLLVAGGGIQLAEGYARRPLVRPHLFVAALALWAVVEAIPRAFFGREGGGMVGDLLAQADGHLPAAVAQAALIALAGTLGLALAGMGPREAWRALVGTSWTLPQRALAKLRRACAPARAQTTATGARASSGTRSASQTAAPALAGEPPAALVLPTAGFPALATEGCAWELPPPDLFDAPTRPALPAPGLVETTVARVAQALAKQGVAAEVRREDVAIGPAYVRLGIRPAERLRRDARGYVLVGRDGQPLTERAPVSEILRAQGALAAALGVRRPRMEAPAPGQPYVALELPRPDARPVTLYEVLLSEAYQRAARTGPALALGRDVRGAARALALAATPHLCLAGSGPGGTGAALRALMASLLAGASPDDARLLLVDGARASLATFDDVPHLLMPVIESPNAGLGALRRVAEEAERRAQLLAQLGASDLAAYQHLAAQDDGLEWLPALVVVVAELADLLAGSPRAEQLLCHLARRGQVTGIHLVLATEHLDPAAMPAALAAQMPARLALTVGSPAESRAILDVPGAECLGRQGDALLRTGQAGRLTRLQLATIGAEESARLARFWRRQVGVQAARPRAAAPGPHPARPALEPEAGNREASSHAQPPLPRLRRAVRPAPAAEWMSVPAARNAVGGPGADDLWRQPLPEGWTDEMMEEMMRQIRSVIAQGRAYRPGGAALEPSELEREG